MKYYETHVLNYINYQDLDEQLNALPKTYEIVVFREKQYTKFGLEATITFLIHD